MVTGWHHAVHQASFGYSKDLYPAAGDGHARRQGRLLSGTGRSMGRVAQRVSGEDAIVADGDIDAAAAAETLEPIQKDGFSPGTAGPLDVTDEDSARAWVPDCANNAGAARFASLQDQPLAEIRLPDRQPAP